MSGRLLALVLAGAVLGGCATKRDLNDLQAEVGRMQATQERLLNEILRQNEAVMDSLVAQDVRLRGDFSNQLVQIERQLVQIQELTGQGQQRLAELRQTLSSREEALRRMEAAQAGGDLAAGDPDDLFLSAQGALERGSMATARAGFEEFLRAFPEHPLAAEAGIGLGTILEEDGEQDAAFEQYSRVLERHPDAPEAATALFRAALIELDRGNEDRARTMLNQLTAAYPGSEEAAEARQILR